MANITEHIGKSGKAFRSIQFMDASGKRRWLSLGAIDKKSCQTVLVHVERIVSASITKAAVPNETSRWLAELDTIMLKRLAKVGLVAEREAATLADFLNRYVANRSDVKGATQITYGNVQRNLLACFDGSKPLKSFTAGDAESFAVFLKIKEGLSSNTVRRRIGIARQFFRRATKDQLIDSNPFEGISASVQANPLKSHFVSREDTQRILDACPDAQWRLLVALARYAGVRVPSEPLAMLWEHVNLDAGRMTIPSPKTEGKGKPFRVCPIFPELRPYLEDALDQCPDGNSWLIHRYRGAGTNLRTQLLKIMARAAVKPWPKLWVNMRASRATELANEFPSHVAADWLGHTEAIANAHYRQTTEEHFSKATGTVAGESTSADLHRTCSNLRNRPEGSDGEFSKTPCFQASLSGNQNGSEDLLGGTGLRSIRLNTNSGKGLRLVAVSRPAQDLQTVPNPAQGESPDLPPALEEIIRAWPSLLPAQIRQILAVVRRPGRNVTPTDHPPPPWPIRGGCHDHHAQPQELTGLSFNQHNRR